MQCLLPWNVRNVILQRRKYDWIGIGNNLFNDTHTHTRTHARVRTQKRLESKLRLFVCNEK